MISNKLTQQPDGQSPNTTAVPASTVLSHYTPQLVEMSPAYYHPHPDAVTHLLLAQHKAQQDAKRQKQRRICAMLDTLDFCLGWIPIVGQMIDIVAVCVCVGMFGPRGLWILLEMVDITGVIGAFIPSCTLVAWSCGEEEE